MREWDVSDPHVLELPSGRLIRGRSIHDAAGEVSGTPLRPDFELQLLGTERPPQEWRTRWVKWPDFRLPADRPDAADAFREAWQRAEAERVSVACDGGRGRTGTALACIAILDGVPPEEAVQFVRRGYSPQAVETRGQRRFVEDFTAGEADEADDPDRADESPR